MRCDIILPLLPDLADRSLPSVQAWRVRRHLKGCAGCQKAWADTEAFGRDVRALYAANAAAPFPMLRTRTLQAATLAPAPLVSRRRSVAGGIAAFGGAAVVAAVAAALVWVTPGTPVRPTVAFAQVEAAMQQVKTVHWIERTRVNQGVNGPWEDDFSAEKWARLDPPAFMEKQLPFGKRQSIKMLLSTATQSILQEQKNDGIQYTVIDETEWNKIVGGNETKWLRMRIAWEAIAPVAAKPMTSSKGSAAPDPSMTPLTSKTVVENQKELLVFERRCFLVPPPDGTVHRGPALRQIHRVWVEPSSHHILRRQSLYYVGGKNPEKEVTADHFVYNEDLPPSTFALPIPQGAVVKRDVVQWTRPAWNRLSADDKNKIQYLIDCSDEGYRSTDFAKFTSAWSLDYLNQTNPVDLPEGGREKQWQDRVARQRNKWKAWRSRCVGGYEQNTLFGTSLPAGSPPILCVRVLVTGQANVPRTGRIWNAPATFYLRRLSDHEFRIVDWENAEALRTGWATIPELNRRRKR